jgi:hypothetical protein
VKFKASTEELLRLMHALQDERDDQRRRAREEFLKSDQCVVAPGSLWQVSVKLRGNKD